MIKVLFVCLGNICRSPLAEAIFKDMVKKRSLQHLILCDSAGTSNYHIGSRPDKRTLLNAQKNNIIIDHFAQQFKEHHFEQYNYIVAMDASNRSNILKLNSKGLANEKKVFLMREFEPDAADLDVPDPYFGGEEGFQNVHDILISACQNFLEYITKENGWAKTSS